MWGPKNFEDFKDLIDFAITHKEWFFLGHLSEDAAGRPQIHT
jgi:hypothetical protein